MSGGRLGGGCPLARPELVPLVDELVRRFGDGDVPVMLTLRDLPTGARHALADLFGQDRLPPSSGRLRVSRLVEAVGLDSVAGLRAMVETLRGPLPDRRRQRVAERAERAELWAWLDIEANAMDLFGGGTIGSAGAWVDRLRAQGPRGGVGAHRRRLEQALPVLNSLPADGVPLAALANDLLGDPHALDRGRRLAAIVLDAVALAARVPLATDAESTRLLWESVGVAPDPLSSTVLVLGLDVDAPQPLGAWLDAAHEAGEPLVLTLAQIRRWPVAPLPKDGCAYVVENPSLVAEAARLGWSGPALVCSSGRPTVAVVSLVRQLAAGGASVFQHADFDATGVAITAWLADRAGTRPWRMSADDYVTAAKAGEPAQHSLGALAATPWDERLAVAMRDTGRPVYEEELRAELLAAMRADGSRRLVR